MECVVEFGLPRSRLAAMALADSVAVDPTSVRQPFNDTDSDQLWLIFGAPNEVASTLELSPEDIEWMYPDGLKAMPEELT